MQRSECSPGGRWIYISARVSAPADREDGWQENVTETLEREAATISRVLDRNGSQLIVKIPLIESIIQAAVWQVSVGRQSIHCVGRRRLVGPFGADAWICPSICHLQKGGPDICGMKAAINEVPQLSILDGWWKEAYNGKNGRALGYEENDGNHDQADAAEL